MNVNISDIMITSLETISAFDAATGDFKFTLDDLQNTTISQTQGKTDLTGKQGRKLNTLKKDKAVTISGTSGIVSAGLMELQTGSVFEDKTTTVKWIDYLFVDNDAVETNYVAVGTPGNEIGQLFLKKPNNTLGTPLTQDAAASPGKFAYDPATKLITFDAGEVPDGTEIVVFYMRKIKATVLTNMSDRYSEKATLYVDAFGEDSCAGIYRVQFLIPKADFDGNFEITMGGDQVLHSFSADSLSGACGAASTFFTYTIFESNVADAA